MLKETFLKKVKEIYPKEYTLHTAIKTGDRFAGRMLQDMAGGTINPSMIIVQCNLGEIDALRDKAQLIVDKQKKFFNSLWGSL